MTTDLGPRPVATIRRWGFATGDSVTEDGEPAIVFVAHFDVDDVLRQAAADGILLGLEMTLDQAETVGQALLDAAARRRRPTLRAVD